MREMIVKVNGFQREGHEPVFRYEGELIRCRNCKHHKGYNCDRLYGMQDAFMARDDDYCSWAEPVC